MATTPATFGKPLAAGSAKKGACEAAILFLHGFGDRPEGWFQALMPWRDVAPKSWRWVHLRAPKLEQPAYGGESVPAWGEVYSQKCTVVGSEDHDGPDKGGHHAASVAAVHKIVDTLQADSGLPAEKIVVAGFSQGAAVALQAVLTYPKRLGGCVALSGWLTPGSREALKSRKSELSKLPILLCHGDKDKMVGFDCAEAAVKELNECGVSLRFEKLDGRGHTSCNSELKAFAEFVHTAFGSKAANVVEWDEEDPADSDDESSEEGPNVIYVSERLYKELKSKMEKSESISKEQVMGLTDYAGFEDDEVLTPLLLETGDQEFESMEDLVTKLGPQAAADSFAKAKPAELQNMTVKEMKEADDASDIEMEGEEGEEEEMNEEDEEEEVDEEEEEARATKKAKTE